MGLRFRKSIKIAPGVKLNFSKKSVGVSVGGKYGGVSFNSKSGTTVRASAPGTGLSYSSKVSGGSKRATKDGSSSSAASSNYRPTSTPSNRTYAVSGTILIVLSVPLFVFSLLMMPITIAGGVVFALFAVLAFLAGRHYKKVANEQNAKSFSNVDECTTNEDKKEELLELQKILLNDSPNELIMSEKQLETMAMQAAENSFRIMNDCTNLLQTTATPEVFFDRLKLFDTHCQSLVALEKYVEFSGASPSELYNTLLNEKQDVIREFIIRYLHKVNTKADGLKTAKGKLSQYQKFYDSLKPYFEEMNSDNIDYIETKYRAYTQGIN